QRLLDIEKIKTAPAQEITSLKLRVKKLEKKGGSRTHKLKRLYKVGRSARVISSVEDSLGDQEDASKQGRIIIDIDKDAKTTLVIETQGRYGDDMMFDTCVLDDEEVFAGQDVAEQEINVAKKEVSIADPVTTAGEVVTTAGVEVSTADDLTLAQTLIEIRSTRPKAKRTVFKEPGESTTTTPAPILSKIKDKAELQAKIEEEERLVRQREEEANIASWDNVQATMDADYQMAQQLQAEEQEELTIEEKSKLFVQLLEARKKHFAALRAQEKRNNPPTKAQKRNTMETREESSSKRARDELEHEKEKKQKVDDDKEKEDLQQCFEIVLEEVVINVIPLATKPVVIVDFQIHKLFKTFNIEDLETLWKLVKAKHRNTIPEESYERVLWGDLKTMFEHHIEDAVWRNLQGKKVLLWKLYDSRGIHFMRFQDMHVCMLVEKKHPLTPAIITNMLNRKLQADHWNEICYQLLKLITKQLKNQ
ncbi:hypothetical protein Tco_1451499, partial [Tanacetum coccineum]